MNQNHKVLSLISLSMKAGKVVSGGFCTEKAIKNGSARLVIISSEASENTRKKFTDMCRYRQIPWYVFGEKEELGHAMGKEFRVMLAITDENLAAALKAQLGL